MIRKNIENISHNTPNFQIWAPNMEPVAWLIRGPARFFHDLLFGTSGGYPLGPILAFTGAPLVRFCRLFGRLQLKVCSNFQRLQSNKWYQQQLQKKGKDSKQLYRASSQTNIVPTEHEKVENWFLWHLKRNNYLDEENPIARLAVKTIRNHVFLCFTTSPQQECL